ncbi:MAG: DUF4282 domain-containing protein [Parerythrobacter sp.]
MISPSVLKLVYWLGLVGILIYSLTALFAGLSLMQLNATAGLGAIVMAIIYGVLGILVWRVTIEYLVAFFQIHRKVTDSTSLTFVDEKISTKAAEE